MAVLGTGAAFFSLDVAARHGFEGADMQAELLPANLRRRTSVATKVAFAAAERACRNANVEPSTLPVIFTSSLGEIDVTDKLCSDIAAQHYPLSPTRFHNSVHNTAAGYWSIAVGNHHPAMAMAAYQDSLALGLLEAWSQLHTVDERVLLVYFEETPPERMLPDNDWPSCAVALVLSTQPSAPAPMARLSAPHQEKGRHDSDRYALHSPVLSALPLLRAIRQCTSGRVPITPEGDGLWYVEVTC